MIATNGIKTNLKTLIEAEANNEAWMYDQENHQVYGRFERFAATEEEYKRLTTHHTICQRLYALSKENDDFPYTSLVYFAIGKSAHKQSEFHKGYSWMDLKKTEKILKWLTKLAKHCKDPKYKKYDVIVHAIVKFYEKISQDDKIFNAVLSQFNPEGKKVGDWKTMESFYRKFITPLFGNLV